MLIDLDFIKDNLHKDGVLTKNRCYMRIPKKPDFSSIDIEFCCLYCGEKISHFKKGGFCSQEHELSYLRETAEFIWIHWQDFRHSVIHRDKGVCKVCSINAYLHNRVMREIKKHPWDFMVNLEVHHVVHISEGGECFNPDNCITVCTTCHSMMHKDDEEKNQTEQQKEPSKNKEELLDLEEQWYRGGEYTAKGVEE
ncbi:MAG: HNH endonuclease [Candidatus Thorarchaeota archaeon]